MLIYLKLPDQLLLTQVLHFLRPHLTILFVTALLNGVYRGHAFSICCANRRVLKVQVSLRILDLAFQRRQTPLDIVQCRIGLGLIGSADSQALCVGLRPLHNTTHADGKSAKREYTTRKFHDVFEHSKRKYVLKLRF